MLHDLLSIKQISSGTFNSSSYSKSSKKLAFAQANNIFIINFKNGILKRESVKMVLKEEYVEAYKFGEPTNLVFPILRPQPGDEGHFIKCSLSDSFFPSLGGDFQLLAASTNNGHVFIFKSPDISSTSSNYFWEKVVSISDITFQLLTDKSLNIPIEENKSDWVDRNINPRNAVHQGELVSNLEFKKRYEWLDVLCMDWSSIMNGLNESEENIEGSEIREVRITILALGTKRGLIFYRCLIPNTSDVFDDANLSFLSLSEQKEWITAVKWKPSSINFNNNKDVRDSIIAIAFGDGSVQLNRVNNEGEMVLIDTIVSKDYNSSILLEWSPPNDNGETYLFISKGIGFYLYNFEKKQLSSLFVKHRANITCVSFSDYSHFSTSSLDNNIIDFKLQPTFWDAPTQDNLIPVSINYLTVKEDDVRGIGIYSLLASQNKLLTIYLENIPPGSTMFHSKFVTSRTKISYRDPPFGFQSFKQSFLHKFETEKSKDLWDYFIYINVYSGEEIFGFIKELCPNDDDKDFNTPNLVWKCRLIIKLFYILKKKSKGLITEELDDRVTFYKNYIHRNYIYQCLENFIGYYKQNKDGDKLVRYQKVSLSLMANYLKGLADDTLASEIQTSGSIDKKNIQDFQDIYNHIITIIMDGERSEITDCCFYCQKEIEITKNVLNYIDCPQCESELERCSRTMLLLSTPKTLNCDFCHSKSLVFVGEDSREQPGKLNIVDSAVFEKSSYEYQFPWITKLSNDQTCIYCSTPLNGNINEEDVIQ